MAANSSLGVRVLLLCAAIGLGAVSLSYPSAPVASASGWSTRANTYCTSGPEGSAILDWSDYHPVFDWAKNWGWLWHYSGNWDLKDSGNGERVPLVTSDGQLWLVLAAAYESGSWQATGAAQASFISGTTTYYGNVATCN